jgi:hypothetical protein
MAATYASVDDAYWAFFDTFNAKDAGAWAGVMSYPHVRVSPRGESRVFETAADYSGNASWERFEATGWVRTQGIEPTTIHESEQKVHIAGGWTRFNAHDEVILENRVTYVITRVGQGWGIQGRFGIDSYAGEQDMTATAEAAVSLVESYLDAWDSQDFAACAGYCNFSLVEADPGEVQQWQDVDAFEETLSARAWHPTRARTVHAAQVGANAVNVALEVTLGDGGKEQAVFLLTQHATP